MTIRENETGAEVVAGGRRKRVLSGMRPTGRLHIGHYFGALQNWVRLQNAVLPTVGEASSAGAREMEQRARYIVPLQGEKKSYEQSEEKGADLGRPPLQGQEKEYECFYFIADWHALTSDYADTSAVAQNSIEIATDYLAAGIDPAKSVIFLQSSVPEHAELHLLLSMVTPLGWLERVPTYKEALENIKDKDLHTYGFLGYPVLQTADIVLYSEPRVPLLVPVGEDQVSHVELSREIVRKASYHFGIFIDTAALSLEENNQAAWLLDQTFAGLPQVLGQYARFYPREKIDELGEKFRKAIREMGYDNFVEVFSKSVEAHAALNRFVQFRRFLIEPDAMLTQTPRIPGLDGRKMSKSYGNAITLSESDADIRAKTKVMKTDPARQRRTDPGNPDVCPVYDWHKLFSVDEPGRLAWVRQGCTTAGIGCIECKGAMAENLIKWIAPVRERRVRWENDKKGVLEIIDKGSRQARAVAKTTMERVREAVFHWKDKRKEVASG